MKSNNLKAKVRVWNHVWEEGAGGSQGAGCVHNFVE